MAEIKPLEWIDATAHSPFGDYRIDFASRDKLGLILPGCERDTFPFFKEGEPSELRAAAQADFEQRIRSCLADPAPQQALIAELVEALQTELDHLNRDVRWADDSDLAKTIMRRDAVEAALAKAKAVTP